MRPLRYLLLMVPVLLMASNCPNKKNKEPNVIRGRLMYGCDTPAPNIPLMLKAGSKFVETVDGLKEIYTDEDGYFEFNFQPVMSWYTLMSSSEKIMSQIPNQNFVDLGEVNIGGRVNTIIKLQVSNPYTENDTLYYYDWNYPYNGASHWVKKVAGPFQNEVVDTIQNRPYTKYPLTYSQIPKMSVNYYLNSYQNNEDAYFQTPFCTNQFSEAILVID